MVYHIRNISTDCYYTGNPERLWDEDEGNAQVFDDKKSAREERRSFINNGSTYYYLNRNNIYVTKAKD